MTTQSNIDPRRVHFVTLAKGIQDIGDAVILNDRGRGRIAVSMVMAAKAVSSDADLYGAFINACKGVHADAKEAKNIYANGWAFFRDNIGDVRADAGIKKPEAVTLDKMMADDTKDMDSGMRAYSNKLTGARQTALLFGAAIVVQFDACGVDWNNVMEGPHNTVTVDKVNALRLFEHAKLDKTINGWIMALFPISATIGKFRFGTLADLGVNELRKQNIKPTPVQRKTADTAAMRDRLTLIASDLDKADAKTYDAMPNDNVALKAFIGIANALNDGSLKGVRFNKNAYTIIEAIVEGASEEAEGKPVNATYKALMDFASKLADKRIPADKKAA